MQTVFVVLKNAEDTIMEQNCFLLFFQNTYKKIPILSPWYTPEK